MLAPHIFHFSNKILLLAKLRMTARQIYTSLVKYFSFLITFFIIVENHAYHD
jgi:hypothetical protein